MNDGLLSQEEIDSLLKKSQELNDDDLFDNQEKDVLGEIGNISMATAATALSTLLGRKVNITTPKVEVTSLKNIQSGLPTPQVILQVKFEEGLFGTNILLMKLSDASIIANLMMGGDGTNPNMEMSEIEISAVSEAMNQMIGSASTSISTMLNRSINIYPPNTQIWDASDEIQIEGVSFEGEIVKIAFRMTVEGLVDSEIMQLYSIDAAKEIINTMMGGGATSSQEQQSSQEEAIHEEVALDLEREHTVNIPQEPAVTVQKPQYTQLEDKNMGERPKNIDLILDVPLEFSVVLGKTQKTIKEVLSLNPGSVVELNKFAEEPLEIYANGKLIAQGEVVIVNENFGVRITNILSEKERVKKLK